MAQIHEDVLKCITTLRGERCVMMDSLMHQPESFVTCSDTGRLLSTVHSSTQKVYRALRPFL